MDFNRCFVFFVLLCIFGICRTEGYNFDACPTSENDFLNVTFGSLVVKCNTKYDLELVSPSPEIRYLHAAQDKFYEVLMIDPDAPSAKDPKCRCWLHILLSNVKGEDLQNGISVTGSTTVQIGYKPPTPPKGSDYHRYILAAFGHVEPFKEPKQTITTRCGFDINLFTEAHNLNSSPDASNMFQTITEHHGVGKGKNEL